jgi:hypothetical protein
MGRAEKLRGGRRRRAAKGMAPGGPAPPNRLRNKAVPPAASEFARKKPNDHELPSEQRMIMFCGVLDAFLVRRRRSLRRPRLLAMTIHTFISKHYQCHCERSEAISLASPTNITARCWVTLTSFANSTYKNEQTNCCYFLVLWRLAACGHVFFQGKRTPRCCIFIQPPSADTGCNTPRIGPGWSGRCGR